MNSYGAKHAPSRRAGLDYQWVVEAALPDKARISLKFYNLVHEVAGTAGESLEVDQVTPWGEVIHSACAKFGPEFRSLVMPSPGTLGPQVRILLNGRILLDDDLERPVGDGGEVVFFSAISGG
ncbi:MAG: MoaD/ThiS family protein [Firmicutes bacterium]|nr:MoaD/ThiS family protein [Bacillota bacterium]